MDPTIDAAALKAVLQEQAVTGSTRVVALLCALALGGAVLESVRRRRLLEEFTPIWVTCALAVLALAASFDLLLWITNAIGAWTPSSTVFFLVLAFLMAISLSYAMRLSQLSQQVRVLTQELALLRERGADRGDP